MSTLLIISGLLLLVGGVWFSVTQPLLPVTQGRGAPAVEPARLEAVLVLSE